MKINEIVNRYISCEGCNFQRSYQLPETESKPSFKWHCPNCGQQWLGETDEITEKITVNKGKGKEVPRFILVKLDRDLVPIVLVTIGAAWTEEGNDQEVFRLEADRIDKRSNPSGLAQFRVVPS